MKIASTDSQVFKAKNTFLQKSKTAFADAKQVLKKEGLTPLAKSKAAKLEKIGAYYKSLHFEAEARLENRKSEKEFEKLREYEYLAQFPGISGMLKMAKHFIKASLLKFDSAITLGDAVGAFPERFKSIDNINNVPPRNYKY